MHAEHVKALQRNFSEQDEEPAALRSLIQVIVDEMQFLNLVEMQILEMCRFHYATTPSNSRLLTVRATAFIFPRGEDMASMSFPHFESSQ